MLCAREGNVNAELRTEREASTRERGSSTPGTVRDAGWVVGWVRRLEEGGRAGGRPGERIAVGGSGGTMAAGGPFSVDRAPPQLGAVRKTHLLAAVTALCRTALSGPAPSDRGALGAPGVIVAITPKVVGW